MGSTIAYDFLSEVDILVNNAGVLTRTPFLTLPIEEFDRIIDTNLKAPFVLTQLVADRMQQQAKKGSIINISSLSDRLAAPGLSHYQCAKAGVVPVPPPNSLNFQKKLPNYESL